MSNFELAIDDYKALLDIQPNNTLIQQQMNQARYQLTDLKQREKSIYFNMFDKVWWIHQWVNWRKQSTTILQDQNQDHPGVVLSASRPRSRPKNHNIAWWSRSKLLFFSQQSGLTNPLTFVFVTSLCGRCWRAYGKGECWRPLTFTTVYLYMYGWRCILLCYWANKRWWRWWCYASVTDVPLATPLDKVVR